MSSATERQAVQKDCVNEAIWAGAKSAAWAGAIAGLAVGLAHQFSQTFRTSLGVSGKTALIVRPPQTPGLGLLVSEDGRGSGRSGCSGWCIWAYARVPSSSDSQTGIEPCGKEFEAGHLLRSRALKHLSQKRERFLKIIVDV